jgi:calcineurin-like phosphoesterase
LTSIPVKFQVADSNIQLHGAVVEIDEDSGHALSITRIQRKI